MQIFILILLNMNAYTINMYIFGSQVGFEGKVQKIEENNQNGRTIT